MLEAQNEDKDFPRYTPAYMLQASGLRVTDIHYLWFTTRAKKYVRLGGVKGVSEIEDDNYLSGHEGMYDETMRCSCQRGFETGSSDRSVTLKNHHMFRRGCLYREG